MFRVDIEKIVELAKSQIQVYHQHLAAALLSQHVGKIGDQKAGPDSALTPEKRYDPGGFCRDFADF